MNLESPSSIIFVLFHRQSRSGRIDAGYAEKTPNLRRGSLRRRNEPVIDTLFEIPFPTKACFLSLEWQLTGRKYNAALFSYPCSSHIHTMESYSQYSVFITICCRNGDIAPQRYSISRLHGLSVRFFCLVHMRDISSPIFFPSLQTFVTLFIFVSLSWFFF